MVEMEEKVRQALQEAVQRVYDRKDLRTADWTAVVKGALLQLGHAQGFEVCSSHPHSDYGEWLYDLVWYKADNYGRKELLLEVPLVMESEWNTEAGHITEDFEKLLLANSPLKLFVCCIHRDDCPRWMKYFRRSVENYPRHHGDERYLIAFVGDEKNAKPIDFESISVK